MTKVMFTRFLAKFKPDDSTSSFSVRNTHGDETTGLRDFFSEYSGTSFNSGIYRTHTADSAEHFESIIFEVFPNCKNRFICFAYDWLGRQFVLDNERRSDDGQPLVSLLEPGTGVILEIPETFLSFHNEELIDYTDAALAEKFYYEWLEFSGRRLRLDECVGYKTPLFLGGKDVITNLEIIDLEVYWVICGQLLNKTKSLPSGMSIKNIAIT